MKLKQEARLAVMKVEEEEEEKRLVYFFFKRSQIWSRNKMDISIMVCVSCG